MRQTFNPKGYKESELFLSHEQLARLLGKMYPGTAHGVHYLVAHRIDPTTDSQAGCAQIMSWNLPTVAPTLDNEIAAAWEEHKDAIHDEMVAHAVRQERKAHLADADVLVNKAHDSMDRNALAKAMAYRQALRDLSKQAGFPHEVTWPVKPA